MIARVATFLSVILVAAGLATGVSSARPAAGHVTLGVLGDPARFESLTGQRSATRLLIAAWGAANFEQLFGMMGDRPMLGINADTISPGAIAVSCQSLPEAGVHSSDRVTFLDGAGGVTQGRRNRPGKGLSANEGGERSWY